MADLATTCQIARSVDALRALVVRAWDIARAATLATKDDPLYEALQEVMPRLKRASDYLVGLDAEKTPAAAGVPVPDVCALVARTVDLGKAVSGSFASVKPYLERMAETEALVAQGQMRIPVALSPGLKPAGQTAKVVGCVLVGLGLSGLLAGIVVALTRPRTRHAAAR